jgi:tetratricopeptide (TPR) repeat protein
MKKLTILTICCVAAFAQHNHPAAAGEKPVALYPGLGIWKHPIGTKNAEAQKFFDQGLVLLYGFNRPEAIRSFRKVLELDPKAAMAYWGIAMAMGPYLNMDMDPDLDTKKACAESDAGLKIASAADRPWLEATSARCPDFSDPAKYVAAMKTVAQKFPDDPDAQTWYAEALMLPIRWRWYDVNGNPGPGIQDAERILEATLLRYPDHPGANHFYIHAVESSPTPQRAVPSSQKLMGIVPWAGHMVHMPGHIWLVLGEFNTTVDVNTRAAQVDREFFEKTGMMSSYYGYYLHNLQFILYARSMQGRVAETKKAAMAVKEAGQPMASMMPEMIDVFDLTALFSALRNYQYEEVIATPKPASKNLVAEWGWRYARGVALAAKDRKKEARAEFEAFQKVAIDRNSLWGINPMSGVADLATAVFEARLDGSPAKWRKAVECQDKLVYDEPPAWYYPVRESLGASLLLSGDAAGAEEVFRDGVRRSPHNGRMLFGLLESLKAQKKLEAAAWVQREFETAWKGSEIVLKIRDL